MKKRMTALLLAFALTMVAGTAMCAEKASYKVGFALMTLENPIWQTMVKGMEAGAKELGNVEFQVFNGNNNAATQITNIENMITMGYDAIIVHVFDAEAFAEVTQQALDKGIVICSYDDVIRNAQTGKPLDYQFNFLCSNYEIGYRVGTMAAEWTKKTFTADEKIPFGLLWNPEFEFHWERRKGIEAALAKIDPRVTIVDDQNGISVAAGATACEVWLQSYPEMKGVVACGDGPLLGYCEAWVASGKKITDPTFGTFGNDGVDDAIDHIYEGAILRGDVALDVYNGGSDVVKACVTWVKGGKTEDVIMPMFNVTADTVSEWMSNEMLYHGKYSK